MEEPVYVLGTGLSHNGSAVLLKDGKVAVGMPMRMVFRIKDQDQQRGFTRYFWKAAPVGAAQG